ncbi:MAG: patatin family protein [Propionibacteriaceae bacterium]|nr:patatin family protein [Propionibacteriaceae bacterium]
MAVETDNVAPNIDDVALVFEGGGMRVSATAPVVVQLLAEQLNFAYVVGVSAGASNALNYVSRDADRAKKSFVEFGADKNLGSVWTFLQGKGMFNAEYIYEHTAGPGESLPFDFATYRANPADVRIGTMDAETGEEIWWRKADHPTLLDLVKQLRSSSSQPILMPPTKYRGHVLYDGAIGSHGGIPLSIAQAEGYKKFFIVPTRPRDYVKGPDAPAPLVNTFLRKYPHVATGLNERAKNWNTTKEEIIELERSGDAYVFWPEHIPYPDAFRNVSQLQANYDLGLAQARREAPAWHEWLGV